MTTIAALVVAVLFIVGLFALALALDWIRNEYYDWKCATIECEEEPAP